MAVGRITGPLLAGNLLRDGVDLQVESGLLYLNVTNGLIGVRTQAPAYELDVNGTIHGKKLIIDTTGTIGLFTVVSSAASATISTVSGPLNITPAANQTVYIGTNTTVGGNFHATGNITADGNIILGANQGVDTLTLGAEVVSDIIPKTGSTYNIGSQVNKWLNGYFTNVSGGNLSLGGTDGDSITPLTSNTNVNIRPTGTGITNINSNVRVFGDNPLGTGPVVSNVLYVSTDGSDTNDGRAADATRACRTVSGATKSPFYKEGTSIKVAPGNYLEDNPIELKPYTSVIGSDLRTTFIEPINKTRDLFHVRSGCYIAQLQMTNGRSGLLPTDGYGYKPGNNRGAYATAFPESFNGETIDLFHSPYIQNCTNQSGPWLYDGTMFIPNQTVQIPEAIGTVSYGINTNTVTVSINSGSIYVGQSVNAGPQNPGYFSARTLLLANKPFIQEQVVAFVNQTYGGPFKYNSAKCYRDTGLIVDGLALDVLYAGTSQTVFSGLQYWNQNGFVGAIGGEVTTTTKAIQYIASLTQQIILGQQITSTYQSTVTQTIVTNVGTQEDVSFVQNDFLTITNIITTGTTGITDKIIPNGTSITTVPHTLNAYAALQANRSFLQSEAVAFVEATKNTGFTYNSVKCRRDTGLIIDALAQDLLFGGTSQSTFAGLQYWSQSSTTIPGQVTTTTNTFAYINALTQKIVVGDTSGTRYQGTVSQVLSANLGTSAEQDKVNSEWTTVINIISTGTQGVTDIIVPNSLTSSTSANIWNAYNLILANIPYLQAEAIAYITYNNPSFQYDHTKCARDVGYISQSVAFDLLYGGNRQAIQSGVYYYGYSSTTSVQPGFGETAATLNAYNYISTIVPSIITGQPVASVYQYTVTQVLSVGGVGTTNEVGIVQKEISTITNIINNGPSVAAAPSPINLVASTSPNYINAANLLEANKKFIEEEIIAYVNAQYFIYDQTKCLRDSGLIVDSIAFDLLYPTTYDSQSTFAGLQYWNQNSYTEKIGAQLNTTTNSINFLSRLAQEVVTNTTTGVRYQNTVTQTTSLPAATSAEAALIASDFNTLMEILYAGTSGVTDKIIPNTTATNTASIVNAYNLLNANRGYMQSEVLSYVDATRGVTSFNNYTFERNVGFIVDALAQDLLFQGLSQTTFMGLSYWMQAGLTGTFANEVTTTTNALNYISSLAQKIVVNNTTGVRYQSTVTQNTGLPASNITLQNTVASEFNTIVGLITNPDSTTYIDSIIPNGTVVASDNPTLNAYALLQANRAYIQAEAVAYVEATKTSGFTYDGTKCARDVGYIVDSICFDILYGGNRQAIQSGVYYSGYSSTPNYQTSLSVILGAMTHLSTIIQNIIQGTAIGSPYQTWKTQTTTGSPGTVAETASVQASISTLKNIIQNGVSQAPPLSPISLVASSNNNIINAARLIHANREFLKAETTAYLNASFNSGFVYNEYQFKRHTGLLLDAVCQDLMFGSTSQSNFTGAQYWNQTTTSIPGQVNTTTAAISYVSALAQKIVLNDTTGQRYQTGTVQTVNIALPGSATEVNKIADEFAIVTNIISTGTVGISDKIVPNGFVSSSVTTVQNSYNLLLSNLPYIKAEAVAYVEATKTAGYVYNQTTFAASIGNLVTDVAFDLLWGGNKQAYEAGASYYLYSNSSSAIPGQQTQTLAAYSYLRTLLLNVSLGQPIASPYQTAVQQNTNDQTALFSDGNTLRLSLDVITNIISNGANAANFSTIGLTPVTASHTMSAINNIQINKGFIEAELTAYLNNTYNVFTYDEGKCYRDTGYIIDSVSFDLLHGGNKQAVQSAVYYYGFSTTQSAIPGEQVQTLGAYNRIKTIVGQLLLGQTVTKSPGNPASPVTGLPTASQLEVTELQGKIDKITGIINLGPTVAPPASPISLTINSSTNAQRAFNILLANRSFIANEVVAYVNQQYGTAFEYDQAKCYRDIGYMIDCVSFDLLRGGNRQAIQAGTLYYGYNGQSTAIPNEIQQTTMAYNYLSTLIFNVAQSITLTKFYQSEIPQVINEASPGSLAAAQELQNDITLLTRIIGSGPGAAPGLVPIGLTASADTGRVNAFNLINANRTFIQAEIVAYVNTLPNFVYDQAKCYRDVGIIVENIAYDATFGGNAKAVESGLGYYNGVTSVINGQETQTVGAINYIATLSNYIIQNAAAPNLIGSTATNSQIINTALTGGAIAQTALVNAINTITYIINNGVSVVPPKYIGAAIDPAYMSAEVLLQINRNFIQNEVLEYINQSFLTFPYNSIKCQRDTGLIVDAIAFDMLYPTTNLSQTTFAGLQYWSQGSNYTGAIGVQLTTTTNAISYLKALAQKVILNDTTGIRYQNNQSQVTITGAPATNAEVTAVGGLFDIVLEVINEYTVTGLPITDGIVPNGAMTNSITLLNAFNLLNANRTYLQAETVAYVEATKTPGFTYNKNTCFRDAGYIVDSISFDIAHGGNRQAVQSGVYYYSYTGGATQIPNQITQTIAAYNHLRDVATKLILGQTVTPTVGNQLLPVTGLPVATSAESTLLQSLFANLTNIISQGPSVAAAAVPIALTPTPNENITLAFNILEANRAFLQKEITAWIDYTYNSGGFTYKEDVCFRDIGLIVDAVSHDILMNGNRKCIEAGIAYWTGGVSAIVGEITQTVAAYSYLETVCAAVISNTQLPTPFTQVPQIINPFYAGGVAATNIMRRCVDIIKTIIQNGPNSAPIAYDGGSLFITRFMPVADFNNFAPQIASISTNTDGTYTVGLTQNTVGAGNNLTLYFGQTSVYPTQDKDVPAQWSQRKVDPNGSMGGSLVDGSVISNRSPIQSFVYDAFTQVNQGGVGIKITNSGYAQLVSVFTIFCSTSVIADNGGICSITNSNANFGDYCLVSKGYGNLAFFGEIYNPTVLPYYPNGQYPQNQVVQVYCPDPNNRPGIGKIMEVVAPEGYINNQGLPGFLAAAVNTSTLTTGSVVISGVDNTGVVIGQSVYAIDQYGSYTDIDGTYYVTTGTTVADVGFQTITLSKALSSGGGATNNPNFFTVYIAGNAYYTVLSSVLAPDPIAPGQLLIGSSVTPQGNNQTTQEIQALTYLNQLLDQIAQNQQVTAYQSTVTQVTNLALSGGSNATVQVDVLFSLITNLITGGVDNHPTPVQYGTPVSGAASAASLIFQNKAFVQAEIIAYINSLYFVYDHATCRRDLGYILNSFQYDIIYQSNYQARKSGNAYQRNVPGSQYVLETEKTQTLDAIAYIASQAANLSGVSTNGNAIANITQGSSIIQNIINNGTNAQPTLTLPDAPNTDAGVSSAKKLILANIPFIRAETIAWINATYPIFTYDQTKCRRDSGYIIDALAADIITGSNYRAVKAGEAYFYGNSTKVLNGQLTETIAAFNYIAAGLEKLTAVGASSTATTQITSDINTITNILQNGTGVAPVVNYPLPAGIDTGYASASQLLQGNLEFIKAETEAYLYNTVGGFTYNQAKCYRDTGLIVDAVAQDLLFPTANNSQSTFAGLQYYAQSTTTIPGEVTTTTNAFAYLSSLAQLVITNTTSGVRYQSTVTQNTSLPAGGAVETSKVSSEFTTIINIISTGTAGVTDLVVPNSLTSSTTQTTQNAYAILQANRAYLIAETVAYVNANKTAGFVFDGAKCQRDTGYILDSVSFDLAYGGNRQAIQAGVYYYGFNASVSTIPNESVQTLAAYNHIRSLLPNIMTGQAVATKYQSTVTQVTNLPVGVSANGVAAQAIIDNITGIITNGPSVAAAPSPISLTPSADINISNAATLLEANRTFIQAETVAFINSTYNSGFTYDRSKCKRDVGFIMQALIYDLTYGGNEQSVYAGLSYFDNANNNVSLIPNQQSQTAAAINYINTLAQKVIRNQAPTTSYTTATQYINTQLTLGTNAATTIANLVTSISNIVQNGPGAAPATTGITITAPIWASTAASAIEANKLSLSAQTVTYINNNFSVFTYSTSSCARDTQYIVEAQLYDLAYGGNWQTVDAGTLYWNGTKTLIPGEVNQTVGAFNFVNNLFNYIVTNTQPSQYYQTAVPQYLNPTYQGGSNALPTLNTLNSILTKIVKQGLNAAPAIVYPTASAITPDLATAQSVIANNTSTLISQTITYLDNKYNGFEYNQQLCKRDVGLIVDAISTDLNNGGNYQSILSGQSYYSRAGTHHLVTLEDNVADATLFPDKNRVNFYQRSYMSASGYLFEYVGAGSNYGALPQIGRADPIQARETIQLNNGKVFFTSTDQNGDFRIGPGLVISQATGVLSGRTFTKSLFANLTPFILAIEGI